MYLLIDNLTQLKNDIQKDKKTLFEELKKQAVYYENIVLKETPPPESTTYMGMGIFNLSLLYLITEEERYLKEAKRWINKVLSYDVWGHAYLVNVDLSASWILFGLSMGYHYLYQYLSEEERIQIEEKLFHHGTIMYQYRVNTYGKGWSTRFYQNHNWINLTGLYVAGYLLKDKYDTKSWLEDAKANFKRVFELLPEDGSNYEGVSYWHYGVMWLFVIAEVLLETENINYYKSSKFLQNTFDFRVAQALPDLEQVITFGDTHDTRSGHSIAIYYIIAKRFKNKYSQYLGNYVLNNFYDEEQTVSHIKPGIKAQIGLALLFNDPTIKEKDLSDYENYQYFPDLGLASYKKNNDMFSIKCSNPGGNKQFKNLFKLEKEGIDAFGLSHHHPDNSHFVLIKDNEYVITDDGYNRNCFLRQHNVVTPKGYGCDVEDVTDVYTRSIKARDENVREKDFGSVEYQNVIDGNMFYYCDNTGTYSTDASIKLSKRLVIVADFDYILVFDHIKSTQNHNYQWHLHFEEKPMFTKFGTYLKEKDFRVYQVLPKMVKKDIDEQYIKTIYTTQEPDVFKEKTMYDAYYESSEEKEVVFLNVLSFKELDVVYKDNELYIKNGKFIDSFRFSNENKATFKFMRNQLTTMEKTYVYNGSLLVKK